MTQTKTVDEMAINSFDCIPADSKSKSELTIFTFGFKAGHASRDAEVEELKNTLEVERITFASQMNNLDNCLSKVQEEVNTLRAQLKEANEVIAFYANGAKNEKYNEFGCGCCASSLDEEGDADYKLSNSEVRGLMAREYQNKYELKG